MDIFSKILGIEPLKEEIDIDKLFQEYGLINFDVNICREDALKRNSEMIVCDKCGVKGNRPNMLRWHFENCKTVLKQCQQCNKIIPRQGVKNYLYDQKKYCNRSCYMESKKGIPPIIMTEEIKRKLSISKKGKKVDARNNKN